MINYKNISGLTTAIKLLSTLLLTAIILSGCSNSTLNQRTYSSLVVHNQLPNNIQLLDLQTHELGGGLRVKGNLKFSARKYRNSRPRGTLIVSVTQANGKELTRSNVKLNRQGRMSNYSRFDVRLNGVLPAGSHLYLSYVR